MAKSSIARSAPVWPPDMILSILTIGLYHRCLDPPHLIQQLLLAYDAFSVQNIDQSLLLDDFGHEQLFEFDQLF